ncbi:MAG: tRNA 4-thiouridine(8) synthase ThiI [Lachnospiraceae bacterium]|nr:tRNA 4-thiouridine(8) synthase ThiI [Lachnospiraceae bacterium]
MTYTSFLIKYAEIAIKGKNRYVFEDALIKQMRYALKKVEGEFEVSKTQGRVHVECLSEYDYDEVVEALSRVFGITGICPVVHVKDEGFDKLAEDVIRYLEDEYKVKPICSGADISESTGKDISENIGENDKKLTFKVNCRRARKNYPMDSQEVNMAMGERILDAFPDMKVDVHNPEVLLTIEIRDECIYIYSKVIPGPGGMPVGTGGKAMLLLSGGIDSPVAGYMIAKRGVKLDAVYFHAPPYTSERAKQKVVDLARLVARYSGPIHLHVINFTDIQLEIYEKCPHDELTIIMRRYMMRIAEHIAGESECLGLITGESLGQVASQTMQSLAATNEVCTMPVYRPLIGFDKNEIIKISEKIDTYETSILPFEDCCTIFVAKHPVTKPNVNIIKRSETRLTETIDELFRKAIETDEVIVVS